MRLPIVLSLFALVAGCASETTEPEEPSAPPPASTATSVAAPAPAAGEVHVQDVYMHNPPGSNDRNR